MARNRARSPKLKSTDAGADAIRVQRATGDRARLRRADLHRRRIDLHTDLGNAWRMIRGDVTYRVAVRFDLPFADAASETRWHPTQEEEWDHTAGTVTLRFTVEGLNEIVWWVLSYGPGVTVLEPPELIEKVRELLRASAERYAD